MIVVHGLVGRDGRLACWAETTPPHRPTRRRAARSPTGDTASLTSARCPTADEATGVGYLDAHGRDGSVEPPTPSLQPSTQPPSWLQPAPAGQLPPSTSYPAQPSARRTAGRRGRRSVHPFAVAPPVPGEVTTVDLHLPTAGSRPAASPELSPAWPTADRLHRAADGTTRQRDGAMDGDATGEARVLPWTVPVVLLSPGTARQALEELVDGPGEDGQVLVRVGSSVGHLLDLVRFAEDLVDRGRVVPVVAAGPEARWRPVLRGADAAAFEALWRAMPGVTHAAGEWGVAEPGAAGRIAQEATRAALDVEVDALVRARLGGQPLLGDGAVGQDSVTRAWLTALTTADARLRTAEPARPDAAGAPSHSTIASTVSSTLADGDPTAGDRPTARGRTDQEQSDGDPTSAGPAREERGGAVSAWHYRALGAADNPRRPASVQRGGELVREGAEVARLREQVERWAGSGRDAAVRTCFRLTYPEDFPGRLGEDEDQDAPAGGGWLVEFLLQAVAEPSLLVPAEAVWHDGASPLLRWVDYPQDVLLADLGRASRLWPDLDDALHTARPTQLRLDVAGAHRFLTHATLLDEAGFGVLLPAQWQRRQDLGLTLTVHARQPASPVLRDTTANRDAIVDYRWGLAIGGEFLSEADLVELARAKVPLMRLRGRWVHLDRDRLRAGLAFLARGGHGQMSAGEAMRLTRLVPDGELPLPVSGVDGSGWLADLLTGRAAERLELLDEPASLAGRLRPYQRRGFSWLAFLDRLGVGALLADDMGLGKTVQVLALEAHLRERGPRPPTLIVCPLSVLGNWRREIERFTPRLTVAVHHGSDRSLDTIGDTDLVLTTYQLATRDAELLAGRGWDRIVLDEAQHVKNSTSATARAVRRIPARHRVALTGTPVENRLTELWSIADFLNPGILGPASIFRARYSVPVERYADADAATRLRRATRPFLLRRVKTERAVIADLPDKLERKQWCNLTIEQATLYKAVVDELFVKLREGRAGARRKGLVLSAMTKLKQVCNHPAHLMGDGTPLAGRSGKLERLEQILASALAAGDRALVFTQFARFGHLLAPHLADRLGTEVALLHGGTPKGARDAMVERFQNEQGPPVLLLSLKAGGTGLNLTAANHVVHVDRWWNPATEAQATDRAFRIGQRRDVQVHTFVCIGTIEERVDHIMAEKRTLAGVAVGSGEGWLTGLSTDDLLDLMTLAPEATGDA